MYGYIYLLAVYSCWLCWLCWLCIAVYSYHYQLQFNENAIKSLLKTHEPIFHGHENGDSPFHGLCQAHENSINYYMT